jgi:hypothetical protein
VICGFRVEVRTFHNRLTCHDETASLLVKDKSKWNVDLGKSFLDNTFKLTPLKLIVKVSCFDEDLLVMFLDLLEDICQLFY